MILAPSPSLWTPSTPSRFGPWWRRLRRLRHSLGLFQDHLVYGTGGHLMYSATQGNHLMRGCTPITCKCTTPGPRPATITATISGASGAGCRRECEIGPSGFWTGHSYNFPDFNGTYDVPWVGVVSSHNTFNDNVFTPACTWAVQLAAGLTDNSWFGPIGTGQAGCEAAESSPHVDIVGDGILTLYIEKAGSQWGYVIKTGATITHTAASTFQSGAVTVSPSTDCLSPFTFSAYACLQATISCTPNA